MDLTKGKEIVLNVAAMPRRKKAIWLGIIIACFIIVLIYLSGRKEAPPPPQRVPVTVSRAALRDMPIELREIGTIEGFRSVPLYAQVTGQLIRVHFQEGQDVKKGQLLFTIDPTQYQARVRQAEAKLAQDAAQMKFNRDEAKRYKFLHDKGAVALSDYENKQAIADAQDSIVIADKASLQDARFNLAHCYISAPFDGRMGSYAVFEGRMIKDTDTQLSTINQLTPVYATFSTAEKNVPAIRKYLAHGKLKARAIVAGYSGKAPEGQLTFMDNTVNTQTGMILLKATFPNTDKFLWPGQFVNVILTLETEKNVVVVPERAIQLGQAGKYAFVVKPNQTVEHRAVTTDRTVDGLTVVRQGIAAGETVVTDGHFKLRTGFPVEIRDSLSSGYGSAASGKQDAPAVREVQPAKPESDKDPAGPPATEAPAGTKK